MATLKVGQFYQAAVTSSDPNENVPPGTLVASSDNTGVATAASDGTALVTVTGVAPGNANVLYSAPGFLPFSEAVIVVARPSLVVTDGPTQG